MNLRIMLSIILYSGTNLKELDIDVTDVILFFLQWVVVVVEVRSNLLSGESERFHLEEICQVCLISFFPVYSTFACA